MEKIMKPTKIGAFALLAILATGPVRAQPPVDWSTLPAVVDGPGGEAWFS
jgi:hypothetical protein